MMRWCCVVLSLSLSSIAWAELDDMSSLTGTELSSFDDFFDSIPVVVTPSKIAQPRVDVSSTLSVLDGEFIRRLNMQYVEDLLQFVPGFAVFPYKASSQKIVSYHGTQLEEYRRIQVLVNGRSVYSAGKARVEWATLPLNIEDVSRVEVNRGPNAASYGINSYFAVVNIITRSPLETLGSSVSAYSGSRGDYRLYGQHSGLNGDWSYRASASTSNVSGFDTDKDGNDRHDGHGTVMGNVFIQKETSTSFFDIDVGANRVKANMDPEEYAEGSYDINDPVREANREHIKLSYTKQVSSDHELKFQYYYDQAEQSEHHDARLTSSFYSVFFGGTSSGDVYRSYDVDLVETRQDLEVQSTWAARENLKVISALGYRLDEADSEHYFSGAVSDEVLRASSNLEYRAGERWVLNTGAMLERSQMGGTFLSPKLGATYKLSENESFRFNASNAVRTPDLSDQYFKWHYVLSTGESSYTTYADQGEREEKITSYEIGYYHYWLDQGLSMDVKLYHDSVQDMVLSRKYFSNAGSDSAIEEGVTEDVSINGLELELDWRSRSGGMTRFTYAYQDTQTDNSKLLDSTSPIMMSLFSSQPLTDKLFINGYYWYGKELNGRNYEFVNSWLSYKMSLGGYSTATMGLGLEARLDGNALVSYHNNLDEDTFFYVFSNITF
ncbi:TonB-dependent siderophore receptor [Marinomonas sp. FW-1]|uniref:TonB-dependent receptor plug domain-containing protein n=1 Tax=Marinomonas sp. FW-1 TaxID=2071621 RepID=UPI0020C7E436|nr:TonB-dependent receptor [Marinomonas sp. FW-1]